MRRRVSFGMMMITTRSLMCSISQKSKLIISKNNLNQYNKLINLNHNSQAVDSVSAHHKGQIITVHLHRLRRYIRIIRSISRRVGISYSISMRVGLILMTLRRILLCYRNKSKPTRIRDQQKKSQYPQLNKRNTI